MNGNTCLLFTSQAQAGYNKEYDMKEVDQTLILKILREAESAAIELEDYAYAWEIERTIYAIELTDTKK